MELETDYIGNQAIVEFLNCAVREQKFSHAYLFVGQEKIGKFSLANMFAKAALCQNSAELKGIDACGKCSSCIQFAKNVHSDLHLLEKDEEKKNISVSEIRTFQNNFYRTSFLGKRKVGIINTADQLNIEGANALLKTLEEPPGQSIIILISSNADLLPATVVSRCQTLHFSLAPRIAIRQMLEKQGCSKALADTITALSVGKPGLAIEYFKYPEKLEQYLKDIQELLTVYDSSIANKFVYVQQYLGTKKYQERIENAEMLLNYIESIVHDCVLIKNYLERQIVNISELSALKKISTRFSDSDLINQQNNLHSIKNKFNNSINPQLAFENYFLTM